MSGGKLAIFSCTRGGEVVLQGFTDDDYMVQYLPGVPGGTHADDWMRYTDANNGYRVRLYQNMFGQDVVALHAVAAMQPGLTTSK